MNLNDIHSFLIQWGNWNNEEFQLLGYSHVELDHKQEYPGESRLSYSESAFDAANTILLEMDKTDRWIIQGIYIDQIPQVINGRYNKQEIENALSNFRDLFQLAEVA